MNRRHFIASLGAAILGIAVRIRHTAPAPRFYASVDPAWPTEPVDFQPIEMMGGQKQVQEFREQMLAAIDKQMRIPADYMDAMIDHATEERILRPWEDRYGIRYPRRYPKPAPPRQLVAGARGVKSGWKA